MSEREILSRLNELVNAPAAAAWLQGAADRLEENLRRDPDLQIDFEVVPREVIDPPPPAVSAWVFILRQKRFSGAERHPNSTQRMAALRGDGVFQTWDGSRWISTSLSPHSGTIEGRWISIPPNVWHQAAEPATDWVVVSFHSVPADELIEERGDPGTGALEISQTYL